MDIVVDSFDLAAALNWVRAVLPSRPRVPVLTGVLITADDGAAQLAGFDYGTSRRATIAAHIKSPCEPVLLSAAELGCVTAGVTPGRPVSIASTGPCTVTVACGSLTGEIPTMPVEDYPSLPQAPKVVGAVDARGFAATVAQVEHAVGRDDTLPYLTGIELTTCADTMWVRGTDRYRAASSFPTWNNPAQLPRVLVPRKPLFTAAKHLARSGEIQLGVDSPRTPSVLGITAPGYATTVRVIDARLPNITEVIPQVFACEVTVNRKALLASVRQLAKINQRHTPLRLSTHDSTLTVATHASETATASQQLPCRSQLATAVALDPDHLAQALAAADTDEVVFKYAAPHMSPHSDSAAGKLPLILDAEDFRAVIKPMRIDE